MLNTRTQQWTTIIPDMAEPRADFACIVVDDILYAIGGHSNCDCVLDTVEMLDLSQSFLSLAWTTLSDRLANGKESITAIAHKTDILVLGGGDPTIDVINTAAVTPTISERGSLDLPGLYLQVSTQVPAIIIDERAYAFYLGYDWPRSYAYKDMDTFSPTSSPSFSPSQSPTHSPTTMTQSPSLQPTTYFPSFAPSNYPSPSPTKTPSNAPSFSPTLSPTQSPSRSPSLAPTLSPTRYPTQTNSYNAYIDVVYSLKGLSYANVELMTSNALNVTNDIERLIERGYVAQDEVIINYKLFWCKILAINDDKIENIDSLMTATLANAQSMELKSKIECDEAECNNLLTRNEELFEQFMTNQTRKYFNNSAVTFEEVEISETMSVEVDTIESSAINYVWLGVFGITSLIILCGCFAFCHNDGVCFQFPRIRGCYVVDDGKYMALIVFALHFYDFSSDINLCSEMWLESGVFEDVWLLIAGVGSVLFLIFPYVSNLYVAANIKNIINKQNESAKSWFHYNSKTFTLFVVFTGSSYASLVLVSSNIFGMSIFSSGLTQFELKQVAKIRVFGTVFLENLPQIFFQLMYTAAIGKISNGVVFAFVASLLSVLSTIISYFIDRNDADTKVVRYYLVTTCQNRTALPPSPDSNKTLHSVSLPNDTQITAEERINLLKNKGKRRKLSTEIAELFGIPRKNIQIGNSIVTKHGLISLIIHFVNISDLKQMSVEMNHKISLQKYMDSLYSKVSDEINAIFQSHFDLDQDFDVHLKHSLECHLSKPAIPGTEKDRCTKILLSK